MQTLSHNDDAVKPIAGVVARGAYLSAILAAGPAGLSAGWLSRVAVPGWGQLRVDHRDAVMATLVDMGSVERFVAPPSTAGRGTAAVCYRAKEGGRR